MITDLCGTERINGARPPSLPGRLAPAGQPEWLTNLRTAIAEKITPEVIGKMIDKQVEKAAAGDVKALKFVLDLAEKMQRVPPQQVNATQNVIFQVNLPPGATAADVQEDPLRVKVYAVLQGLGPLTAGQIAANIGEDPDEVERVLRHHWFEAKGRKGPEALHTIKGAGR